MDIHGDDTTFFHFCKAKQRPGGKLPSGALPKRFK
jgi:hypothetical protein